MVDWHPSRLAQPVEWMLQHPVSPRPFAVIRLIRFPAQRGTVDAWYRIVTWSEKSADRELIGWCLTPVAAAEAAWDYFRAHSSWQHAQAATRMHERPGGPPPKPPAHELLLAYRAAVRAQAPDARPTPAPAAPRSAAPVPAAHRSAAPAPAAHRSAAPAAAAPRSAAPAPAAHRSAAPAPAAPRSSAPAPAAHRSAAPAPAAPAPAAPASAAPAAQPAAARPRPSLRNPPRPPARQPQPAR